MLVCTICICQNQQSTILPPTVEKNNSPSFISLQNDKINLRNHQLNEIWQYLLDQNAVTKILDIFLIKKV